MTLARFAGVMIDYARRCTRRCASRGGTINGDGWEATIPAQVIVVARRYAWCSVVPDPVAVTSRLRAAPGSSLRSRAAPPLRRGVARRG